MELNFIKIAFRNILKDRVYSFINLIGLTIGISFSFLIYLYVSHELSYDKHISEHENVYKIACDFTLDGHKDVYGNTPRPMGGRLVEEYPGITASVKMYGYGGLQQHRGMLWNGENYTSSQQAFLADTSFFEVFRLPLIEGNPETALKDPNTIVLSRSMAKNLFGDESAMGKTVELENDEHAIVTGIFEDMTNPTHLPMDVIISYRTFFSDPEREVYWYGAHVYTYVRTTPEFKPSDVNNNWEPFFNKYMKERFDQLNGTAEIIFQPVASLHLAPENIWEPYPHGSEQNVYIFSIVGIFLLIVACFNYTNLALSKSLSRSKEVGVRKALGANKFSLRMQFIVESIAIALIATIISISLISIILPIFNQLVDQNLTLDFINHPQKLLILLGIGILVGFISGLYPAFQISALQAALVLKGLNAKGQDSQMTVRKSLVTFQQVISLAMIIGTLVVIDQVNYIRHMDYGFNKENLMAIELKDTVVRNHIKPFIQELNLIKGVKNVTRVNDLPGDGINQFSYTVEHANGEYESIPAQIFQVSDNAFETLEIKVLAGREFKPEDADMTSVYINRFQANYLGYTPEEAVGARFNFGDDDEEERTIIGVVEDFILRSASEPLQNTTISYDHRGRRYMLIRLEDDNQQETINDIKSQFDKYGSVYPFSYRFISDNMDSLQSKEDKLYKLLVFGSMLIIFISCLGLFGLVSFTALQRTKEIGIRKVLGASTGTLFYNVVNEFIQLTGVAYIIAAALAWYVGTSWLDNFAFKTTFDWNNMLIAAIVSSAITLITLSYHTFKVIKANPVDSLKEQ